MSCLHISYFEGRGGGQAIVALQTLYYGCVDFHCPSPTLPIVIKNMKCEGGLLVKKARQQFFWKSIMTISLHAGIVKRWKTEQEHDKFCGHPSLTLCTSDKLMTY